MIEAGIATYGTQGFFSSRQDVCNEAKLTERYFMNHLRKGENFSKRYSRNDWQNAKLFNPKVGSWLHLNPRIWSL